MIFAAGAWHLAGAADQTPAVGRGRSPQPRLEFIVSRRRDKFTGRDGLCRPASWSAAEPVRNVPASAEIGL